MHTSEDNNSYLRLGLLLILSQHAFQFLDSFLQRIDGTGGGICVMELQLLLLMLLAIELLLCLEGWRFVFIKD